MTNDQFYEILAGGKLEAKIVEINLRSTRGLPFGRKWIRINKGRYRDHCPITYVCEAVTGTELGVSSYDQAGALLGLTPLVIDTIAKAADDNVATKARKQHRERMMEVLNL